MRDDLPGSIGRMPGLEPTLFGLILVLMHHVRAAAASMAAGSRSKLYFQLFPLYRRATFQRQKSYTRTERLR